jgi:Tol biopolymer transport system component
MNDHDGFVLTVAEWLDDEADRGSPRYLDEVLSRTAQTRQRPAWSSLERWLPVDLAFASRRLPFLPPARVLIAIGLVVMLTFLVLLAVGSRPQRLPEPFGPARNGVILSQGANDDIYVSASDGSNTRPLIAGPTDDGGPWFTHDGTRLVFVRKSDQPMRVDLMLARADGTDVRTLTEAPLLAMDWFEISPQDDRLSIVHGVDGRRVLSILDIGTGKLDQLLVPGLEVEYSVYWRPTQGDELIFRARPKFEVPIGDGVYGIRPDGTGFRQILRPVPDMEYRYQGLELAGDGKQLAYWQYETEDSGATWHARVHLVDLATGIDRRMSFDPLNVDESELRFSPDGKTGAIFAGDGDVAYVQLVDLVGSTPARRVGPDFRGDEAKAFGFSPDGKQLIFGIDNAKPLFVDVASGAVSTGATEWAVYNAWQRLAP